MTSVDRHRRMHELFNQRDFDGVVADWRADARYVDVPRSIPVNGGTEFKTWLDGWTTACSDAELVERRYLDAGHTSVARFVFSGTNDGPLGPLPASKQPMRVPICEIFTFDEQGRVVAGELYYDQVTILTQMGAMPPAPG